MVKIRDESKMAFQVTSLQGWDRFTADMLAALVFLGLRRQSRKRVRPRTDQGRVIAHTTTVYRARALNWFEDFWRESREHE